MDKSHKRKLLTPLIKLTFPNMRTISLMTWIRMTWEDLLTFYDLKSICIPVPWSSPTPFITYRIAAGIETYLEKPGKSPTWHALLGNLPVIDLLFKSIISHKAIDVTGLFLAVTVYPTYCLSIVARVPGSIKYHHSVGTNQIHTQASGPWRHKPTTIVLKVVF